jgi:fatty-acyl-CoA synthase
MLEGLNGRKPADEADATARADALKKPGPRVLPAAPLMHGTALWFAMPALAQGGSVATQPDRKFDSTRLLDTVVDDEVKGLGIVGDAFARPLLHALDAEPHRWDLSGLRVIFSSGVMFSPEAKAGLLRHATQAVIVDSLGSSESGGLGRTQTRADDGDVAKSAAFKTGPTTRVIADDGTDVVPGSGQKGRLATTGHIPLGYYGDPVKTAETFVPIDGTTYVVAGDWASVDTDGTIKLLGRGSVSINTGGEKVYPEEVEEALKRAAGVRDAVVVGIPNERFGEVVTAVVEPAPGATLVEGDLITEVTRTLAAYKAPRHVHVVETIGRAPTGKADYGRLRQAAVDELGD